MREPRRLEHLGVEVRRLEHDLAGVRGAHRRALDREVAGAFDVDHEVIARDATDRADLVAAVLEIDLIADRDLDVVRGRHSASVPPRHAAALGNALIRARGAPPATSIRVPAELPITAVQLATLVDAPPEGDAWLHEPKLDGYRVVAHKRGRTVHLYTRRFLDWTDQLPRIAGAVAALPCAEAVLDGEAAVVLGDGRTSFQALQNRLADAVYFAFDLLELDGAPLTGQPLEARKQKLAALLAHGDGDALRYTDHVVGRGADMFANACRLGLEGIVSKRRDEPYHPGRGHGWLKIKCLQRQELVIGGFTDPDGARTGFGALLVGTYRHGRLTYAGKVGTGYSTATLRELRGRLDTLARAESPFEPVPPRAWIGSAPRWVAPELVCEVAFQEWTHDGRLRHPSFQGLRRDKRAKDVVREEPSAAAGVTATASSTAARRSRRR